MVDGAEFRITCKRLKLLRKAGCLQLIQNSAPSTIVWHQCECQDLYANATYPDKDKDLFDFFKSNTYNII